MNQSLMTSRTNTTSTPAVKDRSGRAILESLAQGPILPTVFPMDVQTLCDFADVLHDEGFTALEVLARPFEEGYQLMKQINERPQRQALTWLIGTITSKQKASMAVELRPDCLVSPAFSRHVLDVAAKANVPYIPGVRTFQDVQNVLDAFADHGLEVKVLKLCPIYGLTREYVEAMGNCFPGITFCPTGEMYMDNYVHWRQIRGIGAAMGAQLIPLHLLVEGNWSVVRQRLRTFRSMAEAVCNESGQQSCKQARRP